MMASISISRIESSCTLGDKCHTHSEHMEIEDLLADNENGDRLIGPCDEKARLLRLINGGAYGMIFLAEYLPCNNKKVAVKIEKQHTGYEKLLNEGNIMRHLEKGPGIPYVYTFGMHGQRYNYIVEELLGPNLSYLQEQNGGTLSLKTTLLLIDQIIDTFQYIHEAGFLHRDISPTNFVMGVDNQRDKVYVVDFGLASKMEKNCTFRMSSRNSFFVAQMVVGTPRYVSVGSHKGDKEGPNQDLESLAYMLVYLLKGALPWQSLNADTYMEKLAKILDIKMKMSGREICENLPDEFALFIDYCRSLKHADTPNYDAIRQMFNDLARKKWISYDNVYDWTTEPVESSKLAPDFLFVRCESVSTPQSLVTNRRLRKKILTRQNEMLSNEGEDGDGDGDSQPTC